MTEAAELKPTDRVLEIGTGSGYQAAVLGELVKEVFTIEIVETLSTEAQKLLKKLGYKNVHCATGDGYEGWPEQAPFDAILITAAPPKIPQPLINQLKMGGRLIAPVGNDDQRLMRIRKSETGLKEEILLSVRFVPMTGKAQQH